MIFSDDLDVDGSRIELLSFFSLLDAPGWELPDRDAVTHDTRALARSRLVWTTNH